MKTVITTALKRIREGSITGLAAIIAVIILMGLMLALLSLLPLMLIFGLRLLGFAIEPSLSSFFGAVLLTLYFWTARTGIKFKKNGD